MDTLLSFAACQIRSCVNVSIINDIVLENVESFDVTLERTLLIMHMQWIFDMHIYIQATSCRSTT